MDGSIGYATDYYGIQVRIIIQDYNRASNIYDALYNIIMDENYKDISDRRDSTYWEAYCVYYNPKGNGGFGINFMEMTKQENGYNLSATYYRYF